MISELKRLVGGLDRVGQDFCPIYYIIGRLYASVGYALRRNEKYLLRGPTHTVCWLINRHIHLGVITSSCLLSTKVMATSTRE